MKGLGHGAKVCNQAARQTCRDCQRLGCVCFIEFIEIGDSRRRTHRTKHAGWMPTFQVVLIGFAVDEFTPDLVAHNVGT